MDKDSVFFGNKSLADVLNDIYKKSNTKDKKIDGLLDQLKDLIINTSDAVMIVPLLKEYLEIAVKNDEQLVKVATIMQRVIGNVTKDPNSNPWDILSDEEKKQIEQEVESDKVNVLEEKTNEVLKKLKEGNVQNEK